MSSRLHTTLSRTSKPVENIKYIISRCVHAKESIPLAIAAWRNMARDNRYSPRQLFFGRIQKQRLPMLASQTANGSICIEAKDAISKAATDSRNSNTKEYSKLAPGSIALMQCHLSKKREKEVKIVAPQENGTSYIAVSYTHLTLPTIYSV